MPRKEYDRRLIERLHVARRWENRPVAEGVKETRMNLKIVFEKKGNHEKPIFP